MATDHFCLKWNNFHSSILSAFESLQSSEDLVDVTLMCEGRNVKAHKVILSACSPYFRNLFRETPCQHPVIILKDVLHCDLVAILQFMYQGEVLISQDGLSSFLKTAELLQVSGLAGNTPVANTQESTIIKTPPIIPLVPLPSPAPPSPTRSNKHADPAPAKPEKENKKEEKIQPRMEPDEEPIQSCSYQSPDRVIVKTESEDQDFEDMEYSLLSQDCSNSPGPGASEEQSILERSLKAQGEGKRRIAKKRSKEPSVNCPHCNIFLSRVSSLKRHYLACKMIDNPETITRKRRASMSASYALNLPKLSYHSTDANVKQLRLKTISTNEPDPTGFPSDQLKIEKTISLRRKSIGYLSGSIDRNIDTAPDILICQPLKRRNSTNSLDFDEEKVIKDSNCSNEKPVKRTSRLSTAKKLNDEFEYY